MNEESGISIEILSEALRLTEDILRNIELSEIPLENIALKVLRLARLVNDSEILELMKYEIGGYPSTPDGIPSDIFELGRKAGRVSKYREDEKDVERMYQESISVLENKIRTFEDTIRTLPTSADNIGMANTLRTQRNELRNQLREDSDKLGRRKVVIYNYVSRKNFELKYSNITSDIFSRIRIGVDDKIGNIVPEAVQKLSSIYENLKSRNSEDWSNAVHSCRRLLQLLADKLFPAQDDIVEKVGGKDKTIKLGPDNYINRLVRYIQQKSDSSRFNDLVGSNLSYIGERLDSIFQAAQKGSHAEINSKAEADRYVVYTYLLVGDILSL